MIKTDIGTQVPGNGTALKLSTPDLSKAFDPAYTPDQGSGSILRAAPERMPDTLTQLEGYNFAIGIYRFTYWQKMRDGAAIATGIQLAGVYIQGVIDRLEYLGFRKRKPEGLKGREHAEETYFIRETGAKIEPVTIGHILDTFRNEYIKTQENLTVQYKDTESTFTSESLIEAFNRNSNNIFHSAQLRALPVHEVPVLRDTKTSAFFAFQNAVFEVTGGKVTPTSYDALQGKKCVWSSQIIPREYTPATDGGHFEQFIRNVSQADTDPERYAATRSAIGYLLHNYQSTALSKAVILYDETPTSKDKPEGGTGKGIFAQAIFQLRNGCTIDGKNLNEDDRFKWQQVNTETQFVQIDDPKPNFRFEVLFSALTSGWNIEKKNLPTITIRPEEAPKICICTNTALTQTGTSHRRRQLIIEFSDHYSRQLITGKEQPVLNEHGRVFFSSNEADNWTPDDWNEFYTFQLECVQFYLNEGLQIYELKNVERNQLIQATSDEFAEWQQGAIQPGIEYDRAQCFDDFRKYTGDEQMTMRIFARWIKKYAEVYGLKYTQRKTKIDRVDKYFFTLKKAGV